MKQFDIFFQEAYNDLLPIGSLAHEGAVYLKLSQEGIAMERELFMGQFTIIMIKCSFSIKLI